MLEASFLVYRLKPFHKNYNKRIVKNPKLYFTDTGLVCSLLGLRRKDEINYHFLKGSIFETFILTEFIKGSFNTGEPCDFYFWRDNHQKEIDLIVDWGTLQYGIEIKSSETVNEKYFDGLKYWMQLTKCRPGSLHLVYAGAESYKRYKMNVVGWNAIDELLSNNHP